jgi:hypothetical protein
MARLRHRPLSRGEGVSVSQPNISLREAAQALAGHTDASMTDVYRDGRGVEPTRVVISKGKR